MKLIRSTFRQIRKNIFYTGINISGLAIGVACSLLIWIWVINELSYDKFHKKGDRIYRLIQDMDFKEPVSWAINQGPLGPALVKDFPEIEEFTRYKFSRRILETSKSRFREPGAYVDPGFFKIFSIKVLHKMSDEPFKDNRSILLSKKLANKYFPDKNPLGKEINLSDDYTFVVSGVFDDIPLNSHLYFDYLLPMTFAKEIGISVDRWNNSTFFTYLLVSENTSKETINKKIKHYLDDKPTLEKNTILRVQALHDIYLKSNHDFDFVSGNIQHVRIFFSIAIIILLLACINFMNLNTARATRRAKEMGIKKVIGANRGILIKQKLFETFIQTLISMGIAIILIVLLQPYFNNIANKTLVFNLLEPRIFATIIGVLIFSTLVSGIYPAIVHSLFNPSEAIKGSNVKGASNTLFNKSLVIFQFFISAVMIVCTIVIFKQIQYLQNKDLGYKRDNILTFYMSDGFNKNFSSIKSELLQSPYIKNITRVNSTPDNGYTFSNTLWEWEEKIADKAILFRNNYIGLDFFKTFEIDIAEGRAYSREYLTDTISSIIINETAARAMDLKNPVGKRMRYHKNDYYHTIVGVVKDFNYGSLKHEIEPMILWFKPNYSPLICVKIDPDHSESAIKLLEEKWDEFDKKNPFNYAFIDAMYKNQYKGESSILELVIIFAIIAVLISCLGLFGLTSFVVERKYKQIGIRKVFGAGIANINKGLLIYFLKWVVIANIFALPFSWLIMSRWLNEYAYHIHFSCWIFIGSFLISLVIAFLTIVVQTTNAAMKNPIKTLRYE